MWDFDVAKSECHIALPSIREKTRKSPPHVEKYQQNCSIKSIFTAYKAIEVAWYRAKPSVLCCTDATRSEEKVEVKPLLYIPRKGAHNRDSWGKIQLPCALIYHSDCHSIYCALPSELKTL